MAPHGHSLKWSLESSVMATWPLHREAHGKKWGMACPHCQRRAGFPHTHTLTGVHRTSQVYKKPTLRHCRDSDQLCSTSASGTLASVALPTCTASSLLTLQQEFLPHRQAHSLNIIKWGAGCPTELRAKNDHMKGWTVYHSGKQLQWKLIEILMNCDLETRQNVIPEMRSEVSLIVSSGLGNFARP